MDAPKAQLRIALARAIIVTIATIAEFIVAALNGWNAILLALALVFTVGTVLVWRNYSAVRRELTNG